MYEVIYLGNIPLHWVLSAVCVLACAGLAALLAKKHNLRAASMWVYCGVSTAVGFFIARGLYAAVCWYDLFLDEMGYFTGIGPFFDPTIGSCNVIGFLCGALIAAPLTARMTKARTASLLDAATLPLLLLYTLCRLIEPLSGQGYGDLMGYEVCVSWVEAALTALLIGCIPAIRKRSCKPGTLFQYALTIWCLLQLLPESLRCDEALFIFVFARITHLGLAVTLGLTLIRQLVIAARRGLSAKHIAIDAVAFAAGIGLCIAAIFALDKTNLPKALVYAVMLLSIIELGVVICRRIHEEDKL